ncbi:unnamed protein product [Periconia digitata]|uniref:Uncharacterized protein n=1 Tax=Periconia digitata TaxID=1303443 RepID=A0A9W4UW46_9PLEO|nr:unnamed protein product [Periconia digitata]
MSYIVEYPNACRSIAALSKPPWTKPLNWSLEMTKDGEEHIPFHLYIQSEFDLPGFSSQHSSFSGFSRLPVELQFRILTFCSGPTLYQLMRIPFHRNEAAKLFWEDPNAYYVISSRWFVDGGHPGFTLYDTSFMAHVQNVEIKYSRDFMMHLLLMRGTSPAPDYSRGLGREFWNIFRRRFPAAKKVVFNQTRTALLNYEREWGPVCPFLGKAVRTCPSDIDASVFIWMSKSAGTPRRIGNPVVNDFHGVFHRPIENGEWEGVISSRVEWKRIMMPPKDCQGPVGEWERWEYQDRKITRQIYGLSILSIEALDRYYFDKKDPMPFHCPFSGCEAYLRKPGQWTLHAAETHYQLLFKRRELDFLPDDLRKEFEERYKELNRQREEVIKHREQTIKAWVKGDSEKRGQIQREWVHQIDHDEKCYTGKKGVESILWYSFMQLMSWKRDMGEPLFTFHMEG